MAYIAGADRSEALLFPAVLDDYVASDAMVRVIDLFVGALDMAELGFHRAAASGIGRPGYDPRDLLRLYLFGYLNQVRSSRRLERECHVSVEAMWLLRKCAPDFKTIADFRRDNGAAIVGVARAFVLFCRQHRLVDGGTVAIDGSKVRACASPRKTMGRAAIAEAIGRIDTQVADYLAGLDAADAAEPAAGDTAQVRAALATLTDRRTALAALDAALAAQGRAVGVLGETEARPMGQAPGAKPPAYNVQIAVDPASHLVVHHALTTEANDSRMLAPMAIAAREVLAAETLSVVADAGYGSAVQAAACEAAGIIAAAPSANHPSPDGFFPATAFAHDTAADTLTCPAGKTLRRTGTNRRNRAARYRAEDCRSCPLQPQCTSTPRRHVYRLLDADARQRMNARADAAAMAMRRSVAEHPFACLKRYLAGRFLLRGKAKTATETALAVTAYNLKRAANLLGHAKLIQALA